MEVGDKILVMRTIIGIASGIISTFLTTPLYVLYCLLLAYLISDIIVIFIFKQKKIWNIFGKGTGIFIAGWFISLIVIYNLLVR